jgi:hypothetical protein
MGEGDLLTHIIDGNERVSLLVGVDNDDHHVAASLRCVSRGSQTVGGRADISRSTPGSYKSTPAGLLNGTSPKGHDQSWTAKKRANAPGAQIVPPGTTRQVDGYINPKKADLRISLG